MKVKKPIIIILGEPNSGFTEILSKVLNKSSIKKKINYPIIIVGSKSLILSQLKKLKQKLNFTVINRKFLKNKLLKNKIFLIDKKYNFKYPFEPISKNSKAI